MCEPQQQEVERMVQDDEPSPAPEHVFTKPTEMSSSEVEKLEEAKLKAKYPKIGCGGLNQLPSGHSAFLQKKLAKGQKYFDSGDYQMAKQTTGPKARTAPAATLAFGTGEAIPTPDSVPARKTSIIQPKFAPSSTT